MRRGEAVASCKLIGFLVMFVCLFAELGKWDAFYSFQNLRKENHTRLNQILLARAIYEKCLSLVLLPFPLILRRSSYFFGVCGFMVLDYVFRQLSAIGLLSCYSQLRHGPLGVEKVSEYTYVQILILLFSESL